MSTALTLLKQVWTHNGHDAWESLNHCMADAVQLAVGAKLNWESKDIAYVEDTMRPRYWLGEHRWEWVYSLAIACGSSSFIKAFETWSNRKPFIANNVENVATRGYNHFPCTRSQRGRIGLHSHVTINGLRFECTSIDNERIVLTSRSGEGKRRILKLTPEQCKKPFPPVKKVPETKPPKGWITSRLAVKVTNCPKGVRDFVQHQVRPFFESGYREKTSPPIIVGDLTGAAITIGLLREIHAGHAEQFKNL